MMRAVRCLPFIGILLCCLSSAQAQSASHAAATAYQFGVFPYLSPSRIEQFYAPIAEAFAAVVQREVRLRTRQTFAAWYDEVKLAVTPAIPHVLFAAHQRVPAQERERLQRGS